MEQKITPPSKISLGLKELWTYRELFYFFTWRDIKVKYKQTFLGFAWAILQPLVLMIIFSVFFGQALNVPSEGIPYPLFCFSGLMLWSVFSTGLSGAGNSMVSNANIIKKIYFPRLIIPMSSILVAVFDFFMAFLVYLGLVLYYGFGLSWELLYMLPLSLLLTIIATFGPGTLIAALNVKYRDFRYILPFTIQILLFLTPVIYPISMVANYPWLQKGLALNPMYAPITLIRNVLVDRPLDMEMVAVSIASGLVFLLIGILYFRKTERYFADLA
jgi:lipopolysaccharide transport system permease protein